MQTPVESVQLHTPAHTRVYVCVCVCVWVERRYEFASLQCDVSTYVVHTHTHAMDVITNYDVIGAKSEALIRINFMLGTFCQPKSTLHKKVTSAVTKKKVYSIMCQG